MASSTVPAAVNASADTPKFHFIVHLSVFGQGRMQYQVSLANNALMSLQRSDVYHLHQFIGIDGIEYTFALQTVPVNTQYRIEFLRVPPQLPYDIIKRRPEDDFHLWAFCHRDFGRVGVYEMEVAKLVGGAKIKGGIMASDYRLNWDHWWDILKVDIPRQ